MNDERWKRIEPIFHQASVLAGQERDDYLDRACAGDAELRLELEELLRHDEAPPLDIGLAIARAARQLLGMKGPKR